VVILEVADTGKGIPTRVEKRLFDPFFTTKDDGTGLDCRLPRGSWKSTEAPFISNPDETAARPLGLSFRSHGRGNIPLDSLLETSRSLLPSV